MAEPKEEIEELLSFLLPFAERDAEQGRRVLPVRRDRSDADGERRRPSRPASASERPRRAATLLVACTPSCASRPPRAAIRASGIAADVTLTDPDSGETTDAVQVELDHADADAVDIYVPTRRAGDEIKFGELVAAEGREPVFADASG